MSSSTVRIGFVGTGGIARSHLNRLREIPEAQIVALCDIEEERARVLAEPLGAAVYTDGAALIARERLDALYVCVPPFAHGDLEVQAARKGLHLFVEKPVNLYMDRALEIGRAITQAGVMSQAGYVLRYFPVYVQMQETLKGRQVGAAHVARWNGLPGSPWWRRMDQGGGQLVEMTTHQVDLLRWCMGEVEAVAAVYSTGRLHGNDPGVTVPDSQSALLRFQSGACATISTSCAVGHASLGGMDFAVKDARVSLRGDEIEIEPEGALPLPSRPEETLGIDGAFVRAVATGDRSLLKSPYEDAVKTLAVTLAANRSAEQGGRLVEIEALIRG